MGTAYSEFIERLRQSVREHEERIIRLENSTEKAFRRSRTGDKEDISLQTADHYRRLVRHLREVIYRHDLKNQTEAKLKNKKSAVSSQRTERC